MPKAPPRATLRRAVGHFLATAGLLASLSLSHVVTAAGLNDTGQSLCYDGTNMVACTATNTGDAAPYPRQDGRYGRDAAATAGALTKIGSRPLKRITSGFTFFGSFAKMASRSRSSSAQYVSLPASIR